MKSLSHVRLFETLRTLAYQAPPVHGIFQATGNSVVLIWKWRSRFMDLKQPVTIELLTYVPLVPIWSDITCLSLWYLDFLFLVSKLILIWHILVVFSFFFFFFLAGVWFNPIYFLKVHSCAQWRMEWIHDGQDGGKITNGQYFIKKMLKLTFHFYWLLVLGCFFLNAICLVCYFPRVAVTNYQLRVA